MPCEKLSYILTMHTVQNLYHESLGVLTINLLKSHIHLQALSSRSSNDVCVADVLWPVINLDLPAARSYICHLGVTIRFFVKRTLVVPVYASSVLF
jgi:hypothetical protein